MKLRPLLLLAALVASPLAGAAPSDPPERVAQLSYVEGEIAFEAEGQRASSALPDRPLLEDDRLATKADSRAEVVFGTAALRLDERTSVRFDELGAERVRLRLEEGIANVTLRELQDGETFEIKTSNTTLTLVMPGDYRVEVPSEESSLITVHGGAAQAETAGGPVRIADGQRVRLVGRESLASLETTHPADAFDDWVLQRELQFAEAEPPADQAQPELDRYGEWRDDPDYGRVWMPAYAYGGYDPFQSGYWQQAGFGWSWVSSHPWGQFAFYNGRWAYRHDLNRWCWTPPRPHPPVRTVQETHPFIRPRDGKRTVMPVDRDASRAATRAPVGTSAGAQPRTTPRVTTGKPRSGTFVPSLPRSPSPAPQSSAPSASSTSHPSGGTMRSSGSSTSSSSSSNSSSTMTASPTRP